VSARAEFCTQTGCIDRQWAKGLCARHYEQQRNRHRHRTDQLLKTRTRNRAVSRLITEYRERFNELLAEEAVKVAEEAKELEAATGEPADRVKLQPGKRPESEPTATDRIRLDVAECPRCVSYHDKGHICPACGRHPTSGSTKPVLHTAGMSEVERLLRSGKTPYQVADLTGMPLAHCRAEFIRLKESR
jgi:hypothetical protein